MFPEASHRWLAAAILLLSVAGASIAAAGTASYRFFRFTPTKLRNGAAANSVQLAEMQMFFGSGQVAGATASNPGGSNPNGETPADAVDGSLDTKWLDFNKGALVLDFGTTVDVDGYRWGTANDATERDPVRWTLEGSDNGTNWTLIDDRSGSDFAVTTSRKAYLSTLPLNQLPDTPLLTFTISDGAVTSDAAIGVAAGTEVTLTWEVTNGASQTLDLGAGPQSVSSSGSMTHTPSATQSYTLSASNASGSDAATVTAFVGSAVLAPVINEIMTDATNDGALCDEDGEPSDWIELHNPNGFAIGVGGYFLTDDTLQPSRWQIPTGTAIPPLGYLVLFASGKDRATAGSELHTDFKLNRDGEYLALVDTDGSTIVDAFTPSFPPQFEDVSYGRVPPVAGDTFNYFVGPTPNAANDTSPGPPGEIVQFLTPAQTFSGSIDVVLDAVSPTAEIRYTTDGSLPGPSSLLYSTPITLTTSTLVRARVYDSGLAPGEVKAEAYVEISSTVANQTSDLPVVILENFDAGSIPTDRDLQACYFTLHEPDPTSGRTDLTALPTKANRIGIKRRGSSTLNNPKGNYRLEFWQDDSEEDKEINLLGMSKHDEWILFGPYNFDRSLLRIPFIHGLSNAIGAYAPRTRFCEVYLNTGGGRVTSSDYQGVYVLQERISRDPDRIDIDRLGKTDLTGDAVTGGYVLSIDRLDPEDSGFRSALGHPEDPAIASPQPWFNYIYPKEQNILPQQADYIQGYIDDLEAALYGPNFKDPALGYQAWLDCEAAIDHHILVTFTKDPDALRLSTYLYKPRGGKLTFGPIWDFDRTMGCDGDSRSSNPVGWDPPNETAQFFLYDYWGRLFQDDDFWQKWIDRWQSLRTGEFSNAGLIARIDGLAAEVTESQPRNAQKWSSVAPNGGPLTALSGWAGEVDHLKNWLTQRADWIDTQFTAPPALQASGEVSAGTTVTATAPAGTVYYTTDGSDPRLPGGNISSTATAVTGGGFTVNGTIPVTARALSSEGWSGPVTATYIVGQPASPANLVVSEIMYHPLDANPTEEAAGFTVASDFEFLEVQNVSAETIDLTGVVISGAFDFAFAGSGVTTLAPGQTALVVRRQDAFEQRYGTGLPVAGQWGDPTAPDGGQKLANEGELVEIHGVGATLIRSFSYDDDPTTGWPQLADGAGPALVLNDPFGSPTPNHALATSWRDSLAPQGTPGLGHANYGDEWRALHFTPTELADPNISGDNADAEGDGLENLLELGLNGDPKSPSFHLLPTPVIMTFSEGVPVAGDYLTITFTRRTGLPGLVVEAEFSGDLLSWPDPGALVATVDHGDGTETVTYRDVTPADVPPRFVRIFASNDYGQ